MRERPGELELLLARLVAIPSATGTEGELGVWVQDWLAEHGVPSERQPLDDPQRFNLLVELGGGDRVREDCWLLAGHLDTVPAADGWSGNPLLPRRVGRRLIGLGAWDMKAGLAAMLELAASWPADGPRLKLAFLADEEAESQGAQRLVESDFLDDVAAALVPEAGGDQDPLAGTMPLTVGRAGRVLLDVELQGSAAHAASAGGRSGLLAAARAALAAEGVPCASHARLGRSKVVARELHASSGGALSVPELGLLSLDRLLVPPETPGQAERELTEHLAGSGLGVPFVVTPAPRVGPWLLPYSFEPEHPLVSLLQARLQALGIPTRLHWDASPADENRLVMAGIPALSLSPLGGGAHEPGEWVDLDSLALLVRALRGVLQQPLPPVLH